MPPLEGLAPIFVGGPGEEGDSGGADPDGDPPPDGPLPGRGIDFSVFVGLAIARSERSEVVGPGAPPEPPTPMRPLRVPTP